MYKRLLTISLESLKRIENCTIAKQSLIIRQDLRRFVSSTGSDRKYTSKHEWITLDGVEGTIGITKHAEEALGDVVYVELPEVGTHLKCGDTAGAIESVKAASDIYSPVSGEVVEKNVEIEAKPHLVNKSCYDKGWLYKLKLDTLSELDNLMDEEGYNKFLQQEGGKESGQQD